MLGALLAAGAAGVVCRSARTVKQTRSIAPLGAAESSPLLPPTVTAVVPARNEARVVGDCLRSLSAQTHGERGDSALRAVLVDDGSTDSTGDIARRCAAADPRLSVVRSEGPPPGWSGKVHAMHRGVQAAGEPEPGEWLLFVDADMVLSPSLVAQLISTAEALDADLVFDVRCLPNPYYLPELRPLTGLDQPVRAYLAAIPGVAKMIGDISTFLTDWLPSYVQDNRHYLTVGIGCTGGQHRSVYIVEELARRFEASERVLVRHRTLTGRPSTAPAGQAV